MNLVAIPSFYDLPPLVMAVIITCLAIFSVWIGARFMHRWKKQQAGILAKAGMSIGVFSLCFALAVVSYGLGERAYVLVDETPYMATVVDSVPQIIDCGVRPRSNRKCTVYIPIMQFTTASGELIKHNSMHASTEKPIIGSRVEVAYASLSRPLFELTSSSYKGLLIDVLMGLSLLIVLGFVTAYALGSSVDKPVKRILLCAAVIVGVGSGILWGWFSIMLMYSYFFKGNPNNLSLGWILFGLLALLLIMFMIYMVYKQGLRNTFSRMSYDRGSNRRP